MSKKLVPYLLALATAFSATSCPMPASKPAYRVAKAKTETKKCKSCKFFRAIINERAFCANTGAQAFPLNSACERYIKRRK